MDSTRQHNMHDSDDQVKTNGGTSPNNGVGFRPQNGGVIKVQPPRREDLQPSYAQTLQGDEEATHGWYGGMSKSCCATRRKPYANSVQSTRSAHVLVSWDPFHAASSAPTPTSQSTRATSVWSPSLVASLEQLTQVWYTSTPYPSVSFRSMSRSRLSKSQDRCA